MVSWWELNETSGTRVDAHGSNDLADNNTVTSTTGKQGNAARFDAGNSEYLSIADNASLSITDDLSMGGWFRWNGDSVYGFMAGKYKTTVSNREYAMYWDDESGGNKFVFATTADGTNSNRRIYEYGSVLADDTWYHLMITRDSGADTTVMYVNGSVVTPTATNHAGTVTAIHNGDAPFVIGARDTGFNFFDGDIDEVAIWDKVLTSDEITDLYAAGSGMSYADTAAATNAVKSINGLSNV